MQPRVPEKPKLPRPKKRASKSKAKAASGMMKCVTALNAAEEKAVFFDRAQGSYNPQFRYCWSSEAWPASQRPPCIEAFGHPSDLHLQNAIRILHNTTARYGSYTQYEAENGGPCLDREGCRSAVNDYFAANSIKNVHLKFNSLLAARGSFCVSKGRPTLTLRPEGCKRDWLIGTLDHEIGTHYLRYSNDCKQPWHGKKARRAYACADKNPTEEGLASLHTVLSRPGHCMWRHAMNYYAAWMAKTMSFCEVFQELSQFCTDDNLRWDFAFRVKRGFEDTSLSGSFCKDQMYLGGALTILQHKDTIDFSALYMGQIALEDLHRLRPGANVDDIELPSFVLDVEGYHDKLSAVILDNNIDLSLCQDAMAIPMAENSWIIER